MDLDHVRGKKLFPLSAASSQNRPMAEVETELAKCDVVCSNCHRERSHAAGHIYRQFQTGPGKSKWNW
jgi:hypothetical protein